MIRLAIGLFAVAFAGLVGWLLSHETTCDSAYRHCPVPEATMARLLGEWCNAPSIREMGGPVRESITRDGDVIRKVRRAGIAGQTQTVRVRFVLEMGAIEFREYDAVTDEPLPGRMVVALPDADRRVVRYADGNAVWLRCARMEALGVPGEIRALY